MSFGCRAAMLNWDKHDRSDKWCAPEKRNQGYDRYVPNQAYTRRKCLTQHGTAP